MFLMWGYEGEELEDIEATVEHVKESNPDIFFTTVSYPIKNTPYYDKVETKLISRPSGATQPIVSCDRRSPHQDVLQARRYVAAQRGRRAPARRHGSGAAAVKADEAEQARQPVGECGRGGRLSEVDCRRSTRWRPTTTTRSATARSAGDARGGVGPGWASGCLRAVACSSSTAAPERTRCGSASAESRPRHRCCRGDGRRGAATGVDARHLRAQSIGDLAPLGPFDGALSNFGGLNCVSDLGAVATGSPRAPAGGSALLCIMGPAVPWEWGWYLLHGQPRQAFRRFAEVTSWRGLAIRYPSIRSMRRLSPRISRCAGCGHSGHWSRRPMPSSGRNDIHACWRGWRGRNAASIVGRVSRSSPTTT